MPHKTLRRIRGSVESAKQARDERKEQASQLRQRARTSLERVREPIERRLAPIEDEARQTRREAGLLAREVGVDRAAARARALGSAANEVVPDSTNSDEGVFERLAAMEDEAFSGDALLGESIDEEILGGRFEKDLDSAMLDGLDHFDKKADNGDLDMGVEF